MTTAEQQVEGTITTAVKRIDGELRAFLTRQDHTGGFTLDDLDALEVAIHHARRQMQSADNIARDRFAVQLRHMQPVPA